ncbi:NAD(P)-binding protein [Dendrothele bispora CBS 962.96]|uniref:NAD(P)-binding protein n=1 Tax=Dendrothele bispora (strain CBS 962.96) TaxID=1314807 RepID=A0A4S8M923_DENBC|nr:NAD(P)-binding protein [Dendrothele bispora CBS 962.96]
MSSSTEKPTRIALVTGAAQGLGMVIALRLAKDGLNVAIHDLPNQEEKLLAVAEKIRALGRESSIHMGDIAEEENIKNIIEGVVEKHGGLDVMVANAGVLLTAPFLETTAELLDKIFSINARSVFLSYRYAAAQMVKQGRGGRIIGASSFGGKSGVQHQNISAYVGTKFAVRGITQAAAGELGKYGITVNAYAPGVIDTEMSQRYIEKYSKDLFNMSPEEFAVAFAQQIPVRRGGVPEDITGLVSYLASEEAGFITGQTISINGGTYCD